MGKSSKSNCKSLSHKLFKDKAKNRVDDLQGMFCDLQFARKESRTVDAVLLEEQVHQMLREWKAELNEPSPASSINGGSLGSFSSEICRLLQLQEVEDDAISPLKDAVIPKTESNANTFHGYEGVVFPQDLQLVDRGEITGTGVVGSTEDNLAGVCTQIDYDQFDFAQDLAQTAFTSFIGVLSAEDVVVPQISSFLPNVRPPPAAFLGPKCALWDCPRPAQGMDWCHDYCSGFHATLALSEGPPGMAPVLRPGGIGLKDALLFAALSAKAEGKDVGIPECEGAATAKSPWNAPDLFDLSVLDGETIREWLFFDKPRRAFESGNRKQRSLPDYGGRGWHESRKQVMAEFGGLKRSYYMDPQPLNNFEWHLYEYEIGKYEVCALYRLELKRADAKKALKGKVAGDLVSDMQKRVMEEAGVDNKPFLKGGRGGRIEVKGMERVGYSSRPTNSGAGDFGGIDATQCGYFMKNLNTYYLT